jgi:hypothetical protein
MLRTIKRLHRLLVDRIAETRWLRNRAGADATWAHYERHARVWLRTRERHAAARARAPFGERAPRLGCDFQARQKGEDAR